MNHKWWCVFTGLCALAMCIATVPAQAQMSEVKEKPAMYSYVAFWAIPRPQWADEQKLVASETQMLEKALAAGTLIGYGSDQTLIHSADGSTHDTWFSAMSEAALLNFLDGVYKSGIPTSPVDAAATKHWDNLVVSHYYNWHSGSVKGGYTHVSAYQLKPDAPDDAIDTLSKTFVVPLLEKLLADGTIAEYEVDTEAIHTDSPGGFWIVYLSPTAEGLDKVNAALQDGLKANPLASPAFGSMVDFKDHRDYLNRTDAVYK
ncbi:MAG TPA: hypothetical protein VLV49_19040 [Terriglobales bacterium]|nr:hypothetical protein [Terriglobales bacterium]